MGCLAGSSKCTPRIMIFSIAIGAYYSYEMKNCEIWAPTFFKHNITFIATVDMAFKKWIALLGSFSEAMASLKTILWEIRAGLVFLVCKWWAISFSPNTNCSSMPSTNWSSGLMVVIFKFGPLASSSEQLFWCPWCQLLCSLVEYSRLRCWKMLHSYNVLIFGTDSFSSVQLSNEAMCIY